MARALLLVPQERATKISHANTGRLAAYYGDSQLAKICGIIAADEGRHELAYTAIVSEFFRRCAFAHDVRGGACAAPLPPAAVVRPTGRSAVEGPDVAALLPPHHLPCCPRDPEGALLAFADMMRKGIVMPAHLLDDGCHSANNKGGNLFHDYAAVADNIGVYTTNDYADIVDHLVSAGGRQRALGITSLCSVWCTHLLERGARRVARHSLTSARRAHTRPPLQVKKWGVAEMQGLSGGAAAAQEYVCGHAARIRRLANIQAERRLRDRKRGKTREASFDWIRGRHVALQ